MKKLTTLAFPVLAFLFATAQNPSFDRDVVAAAGEFFVNSDGSLSWTLGEVITETFENSAVSVVFTQGFQQPDNFKEVGIINTVSQDLYFNLYPNPASHWVKIDLRYDATAELSLEVTDLLGRVLSSATLEVMKDQKTGYQFDLSSFSAGMYLLRLSEKGKPLTGCKFQKVTE